MINAFILEKKNGKHSERILKIKSFLDKFNWE